MYRRIATNKEMKEGRKSLEPIGIYFGKGKHRKE